MRFSRKNLAVAASAMVAAVIVVACSARDADENIGRQSSAIEDDAGDAEAGACRVEHLIASKTYNPSAWSDATKTLTPAMAFALPSQVPITAGNAGNHWITFTYQLGSDAPVSCRYKGGASQAHPSSASQIQLGLKYVFLSCSNGAAVGTVVTADRVTLHVDNGDSYKSPTTVDMTLSEIEPCATLDAGSDAGSTVDSGPACTPESCDDLQPCTTDLCTNTGCTHTFVAPGTFCASGSWCSGISICSEQGVCVAGVPPVVDDGLPCTLDRCDESLRAVVHEPVVAGTSCGGNVCSPLVCDGDGACVAGTPPAIDDGLPCTIDQCDALAGVTHVPVSAARRAASRTCVSARAPAMARARVGLAFRPRSTTLTGARSTAAIPLRDRRTHASPAAIRHRPTPTRRSSRARRSSGGSSRRPVVRSQERRSGSTTSARSVRHERTSWRRPAPTARSASSSRASHAWRPSARHLTG